MDYLGYKQLPRTPELDAHRRVHLDRYANIAQISQLTVHLLIFLYNLATLDPASKRTKTSPKDNGSHSANSISAKLGKAVGRGYGTYGQWIFGLTWTAWLGFLCIAETAPDYMHLTKRFGLVAASQLPIHYLLAAVPHPYSPVYYLWKSPRSLNMALHKVTGKIIIGFFAAHVVLYGSRFVQMGIFFRLVQQLNIAVGVISAAVFLTIGITSTAFFRRRKYWWFYRVHVVGSAIVLPLLFFHVRHIRVYLFESAVVVALNAALRVFSARRP
ncbi:hypothetical protein DM02DRAFT_609027 [Periconia macrospinosa]|uniref:Ferric oxidoreductase domain-containing protein n=1 Tax=Periconia macrospinosa TaxID=97972 RepID=A0A2V1ECV8_9PLEO|nr:hypothetical protein DM02DRAFT_609027 [Periconia macrospinosa]